MGSNLSEGVSINSKDQLAAYVLTVAEAYNKAPALDDSAVQYWRTAIKSAENVLYSKMQSTGVEISFTPKDPYASLSDDPNMMIKYMLYDMIVFKKLRIYSGDIEHPIFSPDENMIFRAVHDYFTHGKLRKPFAQSLKQAAQQLGLKEMPPVNQAGELLQQVSLTAFGNSGLKFNARGELNAAAAHIRLAPKGAAPALFTEVVGQVCYHVITGKFGAQKVAVLEDFDYTHIGKIQPGTDNYRRSEQILNAFVEDTQIHSELIGIVTPSELLTKTANI